MESLVVYKGSFDPITNGHLRIARAASLLLNSDVAFVPVLKEGASSLTHRMNMLNLAVRKEGMSSFYIDRIEASGKSSSTLETLTYFHRKYPRAKLYLLLGASQMEPFAKNPESEKVVEIATVFYVTRDDSPLDDATITRLKMQRLPYEGAGKVSSRMVRSLQSVDIPISIRAYIEKNRLYYIDKLSSLLHSEHRLKHVISVANLAYEIAVMNKVKEPQKAYIAGLLHDLGKHYGDTKSEEIMQKHYPAFYMLPKWTHHQFVGEYLAKQEFGIEDPEILDAICYHATGKAHMPPLSKIIYASDKIDPTRGYDSSDMIAACKKHYYVGFLFVLKENREYLKQKGFVLDNPLTEECMDLYLGDENE